MAGGIFLSATLGACTASPQSPSPEPSASEVPLLEYTGGNERPPSLTYGENPIAPYAVDWKSANHTELSDQTGSLPAVLPINDDGPGRFVLSDSVLPQNLQISIFRGSAASGLDPMSAPDQSVVCSEEATSSCHISSVNKSLLISLSPDLLPHDGGRVIAISAEYLAEPSLHSERFANVVNWVLELEPK